MSNLRELEETIVVLLSNESSSSVREQSPEVSGQSEPESEGPGASLSPAPGHPGSRSMLNVPPKLWRKKTF